jgi:hypothetical protein
MKWLTKLHKSKTMVFNILIAVLSIVELNIGLFQAVLGDYYGIIFMLVAVINVILRTVTTQPISEK